MGSCASITEWLHEHGRPTFSLSCFNLGLFAVKIQCLCYVIYWYAALLSYSGLAFKLAYVTAGGIEKQHRTSDYPFFCIRNLQCFICINVFFPFCSLAFIRQSNLSTELGWNNSDGFGHQTRIYLFRSFSHKRSS